ncbi:MAG TPA: transglutaminase domain-containing protein [Puia sp.]|nr:transglutaminase domain-containing protein [Puia sp.]
MLAKAYSSDKKSEIAFCRLYHFMKRWIAILFLSSVYPCFAQQRNNLASIDEEVLSIEPASPADLAHSLTAPYSTGVQKVRAIFSWVAEHIVYKTKKTVIKNPVSKQSRLKPIDSVTANSANEYVAETVIRNQAAVCEGYARLFKTLCDYAGIQSVLITGYARSEINHFNTRFSSNHYWNAVYVDSAWHLLDVTWASGYFTYTSDEFVKYFDDYYFFTPPELFIKDHFPDDLQWTLLTDPPVPEEFYHSPFKQRSFNKYNITSYAPQYGVIHTYLGDTLRFGLKTTDPETDRLKIADTASIDSNMLLTYSSVIFLQPTTTDKISRYHFIVTSENIKWVHLMYNNDIVLRYRLEIKKSK